MARSVRRAPAGVSAATAHRGRRRCLPQGREARAGGGRLACGVGTGQLDAPARTLAEITRAYEEQLAVFDPAPAGHRGSTALAPIREDAPAVDGIEPSLLDRHHRLFPPPSPHDR